VRRVDEEHVARAERGERLLGHVLRPDALHSGRRGLARIRVEHLVPAAVAVAGVGLERGGQDHRRPARAELEDAPRAQVAHERPQQLRVERLVPAVVETEAGRRRERGEAVAQRAQALCLVGEVEAHAAHRARVLPQRVGQLGHVGERAERPARDDVDGGGVDLPVPAPQHGAQRSGARVPSCARCRNAW
jgi:hypothetical protein